MNINNQKPINAKPRVPNPNGSIVLKRKSDNLLNKPDIKKETQAETLLRLSASACYFKDEIDEAYAAIPIADHVEIWKLKSNTFRMWLTRLYYEKTNKVIAAESLNQVKSTLEMKALFTEEKKKVHLRVAERDGAIYYDLTDKEWRSVKITAESCVLLRKAPVAFVRNKNAKAQVEPNFAGDIEQMLHHVQIRGQENQLLYLVYLVTCFIPEIPHPVMVLCGEKGAAKTTSMKMSRAIIDPAVRDVLIMPNSMQDLAISIANNYMPCFDNMDGLSSEKSDLLCTASTGGGYSKRMLFTDDDETILHFLRCIGMNGINIAVTKPDLLDRSIIFELERIDPEERKEVKKVWQDFETDKSSIVGGALTVLSKAMGIYPKVQLDKLGRMADFTRWGYAIAEAMGYQGEEFLQAYENNQNRANDEAIEAHPVASAIVALVKEKENWEGTIENLLATLEKTAEKEKIATHVNIWPKAAHILSRRLREIKSNLKEIGIVFEKRSKGNAKIITIKNLKQQ